MAYAGALCLLQTYKMMKCDSDYKLITYQNELLEATQNSSDVSNIFGEKIANLKAAQARALNAKDPNKNDNQSLTREVLDEVNGESFEFSSKNMDALLKEIEAEIDATNNEQEKALAEISADEQVWQMKVDSEETQNALLQTNIDNYQKMVESNIAASHTYGYKS